MVNPGNSITFLASIQDFPLFITKSRFCNMKIAIPSKNISSRGFLIIIK